MGSFHSDIRFVSPMTRTLHPTAVGTDLTLSGTVAAASGTVSGSMGVGGTVTSANVNIVGATGLVKQAAGVGSVATLVNADVSASADIAMGKLQPYEFVAYAGPSALNVTGDGTFYTIASFTETLDVGGNFNASTGTFTAAVTGPHHFDAAVTLLELAAGHTQGWIEIVTSNGTFRGTRGNFGAMRDSGNVFTAVISVTCDMDAADTATVRVIVNGSTKVVDVEGGPTRSTFFAGYQVG